MKREKISNAVGGISTRHIEEAENFHVEKNTQTFSWQAKRIIPIAACLAIILAAALISPFMQFPVQVNPKPGTDSSTHEDNSSPNLDVPDTPQNTSILYSDLPLSAGMADEEILSQFQGSEMDILPFDESLLSDCTAIVEGEITNMYLKQYDYVTADDKFDTDGRLNWKITTVVYELQITKVWYGNLSSAQTILIEDQIFFSDEIFSMKAGHKYVVPIHEVGNEIQTHQEYISGNILRDSTFSTIYPYHPQIEVTEDNAYIVSTDWTVLTAENAQNIIMDVELGTEGSYYKDKMFLIDAKTFEQQMSILVSQIQQLLQFTRTPIYVIS